MLEFPDYPAIAKGYAEAVVAGRDPACRYVKLAAKRYLRMLRRSAQEDSPFWFSPAHACDFLDFWEKCPLGDNWRGQDYAQKEPWQIWVGCAIYGFRRRANNGRWVNSAYIEVPRKHDKSGMAAIIGLFDMLFTTAKEPLILIGAASEDQANQIFKRAALVAREEPDFRDEFKIKLNKDEMFCGLNAGLMRKVASVAQRQDGHNPSTMLIDELHAHANPGLILVLKSAMGARLNQLMVQTTTAGRQAWGAGWDERAAAIRALEGKSDDDRQFAVIYTVDEEEREDQKRLLTDEKVWIKANPMWGISIDPDEVRSFAKRTLASAKDREEFLRTRLNVWSNAASNLVDPQAWVDCEDRSLDLSMMIGRRCWIGVDLSHYLDMTAIALVFEEWNGRLPVFCQFFLPETSPTLQNAALHAQMVQWAEQGYLTIQPGGLIDTAAIKRELVAYCDAFEVVQIAYDKAAGGSAMMQEMWNEGYLNLVDYPNRPHTMTVPTEDLLAHIGSRRLIHDGNECLRWHMLNVVGDWRADGTVLPKKDGPNSINKIDGFVATAMANAVRMGSDATRGPKPDKQYADPYLVRGVLGYETLHG